jgi:hypothetical protein
MATVISNRQKARKGSWPLRRRHIPLSSGSCCIGKGDTTRAPTRNICRQPALHRAQPGSRRRGSRSGSLPLVPRASRRGSRTRSASSQHADRPSCRGARVREKPGAHPAPVAVSVEGQTSPEYAYRSGSVCLRLCVRTGNVTSVPRLSPRHQRSTSQRSSEPRGCPARP